MATNISIYNDIVLLLREINRGEMYVAYIEVVEYKLVSKDIT